VSASALFLLMQAMMMKAEKVTGTAAGILIAFFVVTAPTGATETVAPDDDIYHILDASGLRHQLELVAEIVVSETLIARSTCNDSTGASQSLSSFIRQLFSAARLVPRSASLLDQALGESERRAGLEWYESATGKRIRSAEAAAPQEGSEIYQQKKMALESTESWKEKRAEIIRQVLIATQTHTFFTAYNTALSGIISIASTCKATADQLQLRADAARKSIDDEELVSLFFLNMLIEPTGIIFSELSDEELAEYYKFATSDQGKVFHQSLVETIRSTIFENHSKLQRFLGQTNF